MSTSDELYDFKLQPWMKECYVIKHNESPKSGFTELSGFSLGNYQGKEQNGTREVSVPIHLGVPVEYTSDLWRTGFKIFIINQGIIDKKYMTEDDTGSSKKGKGSTKDGLKSA